MFHSNLKVLFSALLLCTYIYNVEAASPAYASADSTTQARPPHTTLDLDSLAAAMEDSLTQLDVVTVRAQKPLVKMDADKVQYDVQSDPDSKSDNAIEMLRKVPLVTIDNEENIQVNGSSKFKIYINGKPNNMVTNNPKDVLRSMPASSIERVEVLTNPGARYDAEGVSGILNIITVGRKMQGYTLSLNSSIDNTRIGGGFYTTVQQGKFTTTLRYNYNHSNNPTNRSNSERITYASEENYRQVGYGRSESRGNSHSGGIEASYEIDTLRLLTLAGDFYVGNNHSNGFNSMDMWGKPGSGADATPAHTYSYYNRSHNRSLFSYISANLDYQRSFKRNKDELLTLSYNLNSSPDENNYDNTYDTIPTGKPLQETLIATLRDLQSSNESHSWEHTFQADYTNPISKHHEIETGLKYILRRNGSDGAYYTSELGKDQYTYDAARSSKYDHNQDILAAYFSYRFKWGNFSATAGGRYEHTFQKMKYYREDHPDFSVGFDDVVPSVLLTYKINDGSNMRLGYNMRISRPGIWYLDPYVDRNTPGYLSFGNPDLESEKSHSFNLSYSRFTAKFYLNLSAFYSFVNNSISSYSYMRNDTLCSTFANIGKNNNVGTSLYFSYSPFSGTRLYCNASLSYEDYKSDEMNLRNHGFSGNFFGGFQQNLPAGIRLGLHGGGGTKRIFLQGESDGFYYYGASLSRDFLKKKLNISLNASNFFNPYRTYTSTTETPDFRSFSSSRSFQFRYGLRISYRIGELKSGVKKARRGISNDDMKSGGGSSSSGGNTSGSGEA